MSLKDRADATAKNIEGKAQAAMGELTGNKEEQAEGEAKQVQASVQHKVEDAKDKVKDVID